MDSRLKRVLKVGAILAVTMVAIAIGWVAGIAWSTGSLTGTTLFNETTLESPADGTAAVSPSATTGSSDPTAKSASADSAASTAGSATTIASQSRLVIRTGSMTIRTDNLDEALASIRTMVGANGGEIINLTVYSGTSSVMAIKGNDLMAQPDSSVSAASSSPRNAVITLRVPADKLASAQSAAAALGTVLSQSLSEGDVTQQHIDMKARLDNLVAEEVRLRDFLGKATKVSDMLEVERELSRVRGEIESMQAQLTWLENQAAMATLTLTLSEPGPLVQPEGADWGFSAAITSGIQAAAAVIRATVIVILALSPLLALGLAIWLARLGWRRYSAARTRR